jgi:hypothetical protein
VHFWLTFVGMYLGQYLGTARSACACVPLLSSYLPAHAAMCTLSTSIRLSTKGGIATDVHLGGRRGLWAPDSSVEGAGGVASARGAPGSYRISCCSSLVWTPSLVSLQRFSLSSASGFGCLVKDGYLALSPPCTARAVPVLAPPPVSVAGAGGWGACRGWRASVAGDV